VKSPAIWLPASAESQSRTPGSGSWRTALSPSESRGRAPQSGKTKPSLPSSSSGASFNTSFPKDSRRYATRASWVRPAGISFAAPGMSSGMLSPRSVLTNFGIKTARTTRPLPGDDPDAAGSAGVLLLTNIASNATPGPNLCRRLRDYHSVSPPGKRPWPQKERRVSYLWFPPRSPADSSCTPTGTRCSRP
jgi:hypothetical protein